MNDANAAHVRNRAHPTSHINAPQFTCASSTQGLFWGRLHNFALCNSRELDFANLEHNSTCPAATAADTDTAAAAAAAAAADAADNDYTCKPDKPCSLCKQCRLCGLKKAMKQEADVTDADYSRFMSAYYRRMDPSQTAVACGCCGVMDVPVEDPDLETEAMGILTFTKIALCSTTASSQHTCRASGKCSSACPCFLAPLEYSPAELDTYNADFPTHLVPPLALSADALAAWQTEQHETWLLYRPIISNVGVDEHGNAVSRVGFGPADSARNTIGEAVGTLSQAPRATLLHLYPELCTVTASVDTAVPAAATAADALAQTASKSTTNICSTCMRSLALRRRPRVSIATGWDLGTPNYASMPALTWAEKRCISKTRILCTALNIDLPRRAGNQESLGRVICPAQLLHVPYSPSVLSCLNFQLDVQATAFLHCVVANASVVFAFLNLNLTHKTRTSPLTWSRLWRSAHRIHGHWV